MPTTIKFHDEELGTIFIEIEKKETKEADEGFRDISNRTEKAFEEIEGKLTSTLSSLKTFGKAVLETVKDIKPDEVEVKAGLKFELKEGKLIGIFAQAKAEFPFEITLKWKLGEQKNEKQIS